MAVRSAALIGVMIVVPTFAECHGGDPPSVSAVVTRFVVAITPKVTSRIHGPRYMQSKDRSNDYTPDEPRRCDGDAATVAAGPNPTEDEARQCDDCGMDNINPKPHQVLFELEVERVAEHISDISFEVIHAIVSSIFEEEPTHVPPNEIDKGRVRIGLMVAVLMMHSMDRDPSRRRILKSTDAADSHRVFEPLGAFESSMRKQSMIADRNAKTVKQYVGRNRNKQSAPGEKAWIQRRQPEKMDDQQRSSVRPEYSQRLRLDRMLEVSGYGCSGCLLGGRRSVAGRRRFIVS